MHVAYIVASTFEIVDKIHEFTMRSKKLLKIITKCITSLQAVETLEKHVQSIGRESERAKRRSRIIIIIKIILWSWIDFSRSRDLSSTERKKHENL